ncbi:calcium-binding protein, partial [Thiobacter aerophilum]
LAAVGKIYGKTYSALAADRNDFYTHLYDLQSALGTGTVVSLATVSRATLVAEAQRPDATGLAYRYALKELNPFALLGVDYSHFNQNGELDLYDPATGTGSLTDLYLQDRAAFLAWKNKTYTEDTDVGRVYDGSAWHFKDEAGGAELWVGNPYDVKSSPQLRHLVFGGSGADTLTGGDNADHLYGDSGDDTLNAGNGADYLEGQLGDDVLYGEDGRDVLIGGGGDDTLDGGKDADRLEGGKGADTYILSSATKANDIIRDLDGQGRIMLDGSVLDGGDYQSAGVWQKGTTTYTFIPDASGRGTLTITSDAGNITVENFAAGELGITLPGASAVAPPPPEDRRIQGDLAPIDFDPATAGVQMRVDELGNIITDPLVGETDRIDTLYDSTGNDTILAGGGNDVIHADRGGNDWLDTGTGDDLATAGAGNDKRGTTEERQSAQYGDKSQSPGYGDHMVANDREWRSAA